MSSGSLGKSFNFCEAQLPYIKIGIIMTNEVVMRVRTYTFWGFLGSIMEVGFRANFGEG